VKDVLVVVYGVFGRGFKHTHSNQVESVCAPLTAAGLTYDIHFVNNNIEDATIDGVDVNNEDYKLSHYDFYTELKQREINDIIKDRFDGYGCHDIFHGGHYCSNIRHNACLNSYIESAAGGVILENKDNYKYTVAFCSDLFLEKPIDVSWFDPEDVVLSNYHCAGGYTNGFYMGSCLNVSKILSSFDLLGKIEPVYDYEELIKSVAIKHSLSIKLVSEVRFLKIRATGEPGGAFFGKKTALWKQYEATLK
jgi:hypothetical protein